LRVWRRRTASSSRLTWRWHSLTCARTHSRRLPYALPAALYFAKNNLMFLGLAYLDPVSFQLLGNLKILTTTVLYRLVMRRPLADTRYLSLVLLTLGLSISQLRASDDEFHVELAGVGVMVTIASLSGAAAVVTEWLMKSNASRAAESVHVQNYWLYLYGVLFNALELYRSSAPGARILDGYTEVTWLLVANNALSGLAVSAVMKYSNNLVKLLTFACSLSLTTLLSSAFFGFTLTLQFTLGSMVVWCAIYLYNREAILAAVGTNSAENGADVMASMSAKATASAPVLPVASAPVASSAAGTTSTSETH